MRWLVVASLGFLGCATPRLNFVPDAVFDTDVSRFDGAEAVVLLHQQRTEIFFNTADPWTEHSLHRVIKRLTSTSKSYVIWVPSSDDTSASGFAARIRCPGEAEKLYDSSAARTSLDGQRKEFVFPPMKAGCGFEYSWTSNHKNPVAVQSAAVQAEHPIARYEMEVLTPPEVRGEIAGYNGAIATRRDGNDGSSVMRITAEDVMPISHEQDAPPWPFASPWWQWRAVSLEPPQRVTSRRENSDPAPIKFFKRSWAELLAKGTPYPSKQELADFTVQLQTDGCTDAWCLAQRAVDMVQSQTVITDVDWRRSWNIAGVWNAGHASETERAEMTYALLTTKVPNVSLAFGTGKLNRMTTPAFPNTEQFDRLFVYVGESPGVARPFVIDPNCEGCVVGFVNPAYVGTSLFVFDTNGNGKFVDVEMQPRVDETRVQHLVSIDASGTLVDQLSRTVRGANATPEFRAHHDDVDALLTDIKQRVTHSVAAAKVKQLEPGACSLSLCSWRAEVIESGEAIRDDERWVVPLHFLLSEYLDWHTPIERDTDVYLKLPDDFEEVAELTAPAGFTLETLPTPVRFDLDGFKMELLFERTHDGVRVTRRLVHGIMVISRSDYPRLHQAMGFFRSLRQQQLVFVPKR